MRPLATQQATRSHPLFDPSSLYGQLHAGGRPDLKMIGYFGLLWGRAEAAGVAPRSPCVDERAAAEVALAHPDLHCLDVIEHPARLVFLGENSSPVEAVQSSALLYLARAADGSLCFGTSMRHLGRGERARYRMFFFGAGAVARVEQALGGACYLDAFTPDVLRDNLDVARLFAAAAELEGERVGHDLVSFGPLPVPDRETCLPTLLADAHVFAVANDATED